MGAQQILATDTSELAMNVTTAKVIASPDLGGLGLVSWSFLKDKITSISPELWNYWKQRQR